MMGPHECCGCGNEELRNEVRAAREEVARLRSDHAEAAAAFNQSIADASVDSDGLRAALGAAVAALTRARDHVELPMDIDRELEAEIELILADPTSAQAGEAWRELEAVYEAAVRERDTSCFTPEYAEVRRELRHALAAVEARRGGGNACRNYDPANGDGSVCFVCGASKAEHARRASGKDGAK